MMETATTETTTLEKMMTKKSIPNLLSAHPRAEKALERVQGIRLRYWSHGVQVVTELKWA